MRKQSSWTLIFVLIAALALAACTPPQTPVQGGQNPAQPAQPAAAAAQAQPTATPKASDPTATPEPAAQPEEDSGEVFSLEDAGIASYRETLNTETVMGDVTSTSSILIEYTAEGPATRTVVTSSSDEGSFETIRIGDVTYMRGADDEWITMQITGQEEPVGDLGMLAWANPENSLDSASCDYKGKESVEGAQTKHYHCNDSLFMGQALFGQATDSVMTDAYADYYISTEYSISIKTVIHWEGTSEGKAFAYTMDATVTDINEAFVIEAPEGAKAPGPDDDIPIPDNASQTTSMMGMVSFTVPDALDVVAAWYNEEMPGKGWTLDPDSGTAMDQMVIQAWKKDDRTANLMMTAGEGESSVIITVEAPE